MTEKENKFMLFMSFYEYIYSDCALNSSFLKVFLNQALGDMFRYLLAVAKGQISLLCIPN